MMIMIVMVMVGMMMIKVMVMVVIMTERRSHWYRFVVEVLLFCLMFREDKT